jgi:DtxR family Mn-dependent transcriptional regulator
MSGSFTLWLGLLILVGAGFVLYLWPGRRLRIFLARRQEFRRRAALEDVLKHVLTRQHEGREASPESVAGHLGVSQRKVVQLIMRIEAAGLVRSQAGRLQVTDEGEKWALQVVRAHRLWETYLADEARMPMTELHEPAEREEHRLTATQRVDELDAYLGHPRSDPHGDPIPTASGAITPLGAQPLTNWPLRTPAEIAHVEDEPQEIFQTISEQGLRPGAVVEVSRRTQDELTISDGQREYRLPPLVAGNIQVLPVSEEHAQRKALARLSEFHAGEEGELVRLDPDLRGFSRRRLLDLGLTPGARVSAQLANAFGDPVAFRVRGTTIALRKEQASKIWVKKVAEPAMRPPALEGRQK